MNFKSILFYVLVFIAGIIVGKTVKINVSARGGCPTARAKLEQLRKQLQSETSENYL